MIFVIGRFFSSTDDSKFTRGFPSVRKVASAFMPGFMLGDGARCQYLGHHRFCLKSRRQGDG